MIRLGIMGSTRGTNLSALAEAIAQKQLHAQIEIVISNKADAQILQRAQGLGLKTVFVDPKGLSREDYDRNISQLLQAAQVELVVLIGYMRILSPFFVDQWAQKIINVHPSLLPAFAGKMDLDVHRAVLASGLKTTGCTVHYVTSDLDAGPIILQKSCPVLQNDTPETLKERVQKLEADSLIEVINQIN
jgi:phosphoribosylglycinamide formyltransferase-1